MGMTPYMLNKVDAAFIRLESGFEPNGRERYYFSLPEIETCVLEFIISLCIRTARTALNCLPRRPVFSPCVVVGGMSDGQSDTGTSFYPKTCFPLRVTGPAMPHTLQGLLK